MEEIEVPKPILMPISGKEQKCVGNIFSCSFNAREKKLICVTSGNSYLGSFIVKELLAHGYLVRVTIQHPAEFEDVKDLLGVEDLNLLESVVVTKMEDLQSLCDAFRGCHAVFHTSSFIDPHGISGYSEQKVFLETEVARTVMEACAKAAYIKRCVFTSSLLASIWRNENIDGIIDDSCWSSEEICRENKLWLALGKTKAEKVAWMKAKELKVNLVTVCPGLLMAPTFPNSHIQTSIPYLKGTSKQNAFYVVQLFIFPSNMTLQTYEKHHVGGQMMLQQGCLAIAEVEKVAKAHVSVYEGMNCGASGRYLCFDGVVRRQQEAIELEKGLKMTGFLLGERHVVLSEEDEEEIPIKISNSKLAALLNKINQRLPCKT
uniref:3-beta hydroxysteroid dehydrogenase/isomerase domain-containing protein n=1 Tax=Gossypium raimondii TaxID=29730 RepID=A0A0D2LWA4_GOSRA|nr:hypothetical protein B456_001G082300 [Gossypium raimondii]